MKYVLRTIFLSAWTGLCVFFMFSCEKKMISNSKSMNERWKLLIQPGFTYFISSIYKSDNLFSQRPYSLEIKAGIRYSLK